jgi:hypothetical protein
MDDPIREILRRVDGALGAASSASEISRGVRGRLKKERRRRVVLGGIAVGIFVAGMFFIRRPVHQPVVVIKASPSPVADRKESDSVAKVDELVADLLKKHERAAAVRQVVPVDDYLFELAQERNRTALILVSSGDRIYREFHDRRAAEASYRQAIHLFPGSPAAAGAQRRLEVIDIKGSES